MPTSTPTPRCDASAPGFTLLELTVILLVLGIAASFLVPRLGDVDAAALSASTSRLATTTRYVYEEAALRRLPMRLHLDLDQQRYWVTVLDPELEDPEFVLDETPIARPVALPESVAIADVVLPALGTVDAGEVFAEFSPEGYVDPLVIHLEGRGGLQTTLAIEPLTGRTRVADGHRTLELPAELERWQEERRAATR